MLDKQNLIRKALKMKYGPKLNRREKKVERQAKYENAMNGTGVILYKNNTKATLNLPKPAMSGKKWIGEGELFQGDSYFRSLVGKGLEEVRIIIDPNLERNKLMEEKLILDQPDRVTCEGTVETVIKKVQKLNETAPRQKQPEVLITEEPIDGIEILLENK